MQPNPFVPSFGTRPVYLAGRDELLDAFEDAFDGLTGVAGHTYLFSGQRGMGKTVLLDFYAASAERARWEVIKDSSSSGLLDRLTRDHMPRLLQGLTGDQARVTSFSAGLGPVSGSATWTDRHPAESTLRSQLLDAATRLHDSGRGLVITVDEIHAIDIEELRKLAEVIQLARREQWPVAFGAAGLSTPIAELLEHDGTTFLRRAEHVSVGPISDDDARESLIETVRSGGRDITDRAVEDAVRAIAGYPFMLQLVGHRAWKNATGDTITQQDVATGVGEAQRRLGRNVHAPALKPLSPVDRTFLLAMAQDAGPSRTSDVARRMNVTAQYASVYRRRLLDDGIITAPQHGHVAFAIPYLAEYLRAEAAHDALLELGDG